MILVFDTETTGVSTQKRPRLVQIAWLKFDYNKNLISFSDNIIKPSEFIIPAEATAIHGISTERAYADGISLQQALISLNKELEDVRYIVGHNLEYDLGILKNEYFKSSIEYPLSNKMGICLMKMSTDFCCIPGQYGYKWPSLSELYFELFNCSIGNLHNAKFDVIATARCFWELKRKGIVETHELPQISLEQHIALNINSIYFLVHERNIVSIPAGSYEATSTQVINKYGNIQTIYEILFDGSKVPLCSNQFDMDSDVRISLYKAMSDFTLSIANEEIKIQKGKSFKIAKIIL